MELFFGARKKSWSCGKIFAHYRDFVKDNRGHAHDAGLINAAIDDKSRN